MTLMSGKMLSTYWREIVAIIDGGLKPDPHRVSSFADHMAQRLEDAGDVRLARRIRRLINEASKPAGSTFTGQGLPADVESQQLLIEQFLPTGSPHYPVLLRPMELELQRFVELNRRSGELVNAGIDPPSTLLLFGPPGCGKTMAAIAHSVRPRTPTICGSIGFLARLFFGQFSQKLTTSLRQCTHEPLCASNGRIRRNREDEGRCSRSWRGQKARGQPVAEPRSCSRQASCHRGHQSSPYARCSCLAQIRCHPTLAEARQG